MYSLIRPQGLEKNPKLINVGPTSIPEARVVGKDSLQLGAQLLCSALRFSSLLHALFAQSLVHCRVMVHQATGYPGVQTAGVGQCATTLQCTKVSQLDVPKAWCTTVLQCSKPKLTLCHFLCPDGMFLILRNQLITLCTSV